MNPIRSISLCSVIALAAVAILILPGTACAAPAYSAVVVDSPIQPTFSIPGIFSLIFGDNSGPTQLVIPGLNATATVDGLTLGPSFGWNAITLSQQQPATTDAATISGAQVNVGGPQSGYSATASAQVELHPGPGFQADGMVGLVYDGMIKSAGVMLQDGSVMAPTWPVGLDLTGINTGQGTLTIDSAQVGLPIIASAMNVNGFRTGSAGTSWDSLTLAQSPDVPLKIGEVATISGIQLDVPGVGTEQATTLTAQIALHPGPGFQAEGTVGVVRDGASKSSGMMIQDASVTIPTWPVGLAMTGINTGQGMLTVDKAQVGIPAVGTAVTVNGLSAGSGGTSWDSLSFAQGPDAALKIGDVATISGVELNVPGPGSEQATTLSADFKFNVGDVANLEGTVIGVKDRTGGPSGIALQDTSASVQIPGWDLQLAGINSVQGGVNVENISLAAEPIHLTAELSGVTVGAGGGMTFDEAKVTYAPSNANGQPAAGAFQMTMTKSDAGYVLTTTSLLPIAAR
jgi:hypothetical protein